MVFPDFFSSPNASWRPISPFSSPSSPTGSSLPTTSLSEQLNELVPLLKKTFLVVNEVFYSLQGEGPFIGKPSIFLRLGGCNLRCVWCDTKYTWFFSSNLLSSSTSSSSFLSLPYQKDQELHKISLFELLTRFLSYPTRHIVITGGEPLLQHKALTPLLHALHRLNFEIEIETNGTISPSLLPQLDPPIHFNVSPKLANSGNPKERRYRPRILKEFIPLSSIFKFVVSSSNDLSEIESIIEDLALPPTKIYLMPESTSLDQLLDHSPSIVQICLEKGYSFAFRLHLALFGGKRGT